MGYLREGGLPGIIKFFKQKQGFGFIVPAEGGPDVFLHQEVLNGAGIKRIRESDRVWYEPKPNPKKEGMFYCAAIRLDNGGGVLKGENPIAPIAGTEAMTVKFFNAEKGYGFFIRKNGPDVFVHKNLVEASGFESLERGGDYMVSFGPSENGKGLEAKKIESCR